MSKVALGVAILMTPSCRLSYELLSDEEKSVLLGDGDGDGDLGGATFGDGDGDLASSGGVPTTGGGTDSGGAASGGGASGGDFSGGTGSGGEPSGGASSGGAASGGAASGGASTGGSGGGAVAGDLVVDIGQDEDDVGATASTPLGNGLSLREAIKIANSDGGPISISIDSGLTVAPTSALPILNMTAEIYGNDATLDFSGASSPNGCLLIDSGSVQISDVQIINCSQQPLLFQGGSNHQVSGSTFAGNTSYVGTTSASTGTIIGPGNYFTGGTTYAVLLNSAGDVLIDNTFVNVGGSGGSAVFVGGTGDGSYIIGNLMIRPRNGISFNSNGDGVFIWHNTIVGSLSTGIVVGQASGLDIRNNIVSHSGQFGINSSSSNLTQFDYNLWFNTTNCNGCAAGLGANSITQDPRYVDFAGDNFALDTTFPSPAINAGTTALGEDRNGGTAGNYNGTSPDMGALESN